MRRTIKKLRGPRVDRPPLEGYKEPKTPRYDEIYVIGRE